MRYFVVLIFILFSCVSSSQNTVTEEEVKNKFYEFFDVLSVENPDKDKLYDLVTDDYFIFENQKKYTMKEFIDFVNTFQIVENNWELSNFKIDTDYILGFYGLIMQLGPIAEWGLNMNRKTITVNTENFETNKKGIFAVGDICNYPGKERLILSGFHETALASVECFKRARPNEKYKFQFTTSSKEIQERLGCKPK